MDNKTILFKSKIDKLLKETTSLRELAYRLGCDKSKLAKKLFNVYGLKYTMLKRGFRAYFVEETSDITSRLIVTLVISSIVPKYNGTDRYIYMYDREREEKYLSRQNIIRYNF